MSYILAIDQSTAGTKAVLFNKYGAVISRSDLPHRQIVDERGWVEHDPVEIITNVNTAAKQVVEQADILPEEIKAIGLSNQRETVVCWECNCLAMRPCRTYCGRTCAVCPVDPRENRT